MRDIDALMDRLLGLKSQLLKLEDEKSLRDGAETETRSDITMRSIKTEIAEIVEEIRGELKAHIPRDVVRTHTPDDARGRR
jgi:hypothetical protein